MFPTVFYFIFLFHLSIPQPANVTLLDVTSPDLLSFDFCHWSFCGTRCASEALIP